MEFKEGDYIMADGRLLEVLQVLEPQPGMHPHKIYICEDKRGRVFSFFADGTPFMREVAGYKMLSREQLEDALDQMKWHDSREVFFEVLGFDEETEK